MPTPSAGWEDLQGPPASSLSLTLRSKGHGSITSGSLLAVTGFSGTLGRDLLWACFLLEHHGGVLAPPASDR